MVLREEDVDEEVEAEVTEAEVEEEEEESGEVVIDQLRFFLDISKAWHGILHENLPIEVLKSLRETAESFRKTIPSKKVTKKKREKAKRAKKTKSTKSKKSAKKSSG